MVVLSACQTGLGDIKEDGVFGLQRGFKKAGAQTLLMSLWKVDDRATKTMMINFYRALISNPDKHAAFLAAQRKVKEAGFQEPYFWASFIMLDD
jgi:CHAT domain-containing protein